MGSDIGLLEKLVPVFAALAGGILTALGTFLIQSSARNVEVREFHREKLETIYILSGKVVTWADDHVRQMILSQTTKVDYELLKKRPPIDQLIMTVRLYEPSVFDAAEAFEKSLDEFKSKEFEFWSQMSKENFSKAAEALELLKSYREKLLEKVKKSIDKYI